MIDLACIITTGGVILFYKAFCQMKSDYLGHLVLDGLLSSKIQTSLLIENTIRLKWIIVQELGLVFIVAFQEIFQIQYIEVLLDLMRDSFVQAVMPKIIKQKGIYKSIPTFENDFSKIMQQWQSYTTKKQEKASQIKKFEDTAKGQQLISKKSNSSILPNTSKKPTSQGDGKETDEEKDAGAPEQSALSPKSEQDLKKSRLELLKAKKQPKQQTTSAKSPQSDGKVQKKQPQQFFMVDEKISKQKMDKLDFSSKIVVPGSNERDNYLDQVNAEEEKFIEEHFIDSDVSIDLDSEEDQKQTMKKPSLFSKLSGKIKNLTGNQQLTTTELDPVLADFKDALLAKNVAEEIAQKICDSISQRLLSSKTKAFTSVSKTVKDCLRETLVKILTPKKHIDIISDAMRNKERGKPYVMVFIGVNGVGKSTNLAKVAYLFKNQGFSVMIAACDNFRSGAVEQVKTHGVNLGVPVYDRGYKDDPADIAYQAIREATLQKIDVVLVDTAGRMQHNEPLMRALSRIVVINNPDLVVFIGEALVGNDGVDQLVHFNKALIENSPKENIREIDAIIVSKFDTVDNKVGAALSMTSSTGKPIIFVGVGQRYTHLKKLNVNTVVQALLS